MPGEQLYYPANANIVMESKMAYPEPTPVLKGEDAEEFLMRLETLRMTERQKRLYKGAIKYYKEHTPKER